MSKQIAIIVSSIFMIMLMTSSPVSSVRVASTATQNEQDFTYSVSVIPPVARVQKNDLVTFDVKVLRVSNGGQFSVRLTLVSDSSTLKTTASFDPPVLNFKQGQSFANSTLRINSQEFELGTTAFRVHAATQPPAIPDRAISNPVALIVEPADSSATHSSNALSNAKAGPKSVPDYLSPSDSSSSPAAGGTEKRQVPETNANKSPIAKVGQDQVTKEGDKVLLDGSASTDPDNNALSFSWDQLSPRQPTVKLDTSDVASKIGFVAPNVDRDTIFRFKLVVRDGSGGTSADSINILVKNIEDSTSTITLPQTPPAELQSPMSNQETENHSPTAEAMQTVLVNDGNPLSISLKGNDPDSEDSLSFVIISSPSHAAIAGFDKTTGRLTYIPNVGFTGKDTIKYKVLDSSGAESNEASIVINVESIEEEQTTSVAKNVSSIPSVAKNVSSILAKDRLKERQERIESKLQETMGEKLANQYIVVLKEDSPTTKTQSIVNDAKSRGAKVLQQYQKALKGFTVNIPNREALDAILNNSDVAYAEPDVKVKAFTQTIPTGIDRIDADLSSAVSGDGKGDGINADIAILDTGIDLTHPDLNVYKAVSFVPGTTTTSPGKDDHGHGTMVAGVAAAKDNDWGSVGVAPGARLWSVKVLDSTGTGSLSSVLEGLDFVTSNANELEVADMSFGCENCSSPTLDTAIDNAVTAGVTIVAAAGNGAKDASTFSPANHPNVIAVSAIADSDGKCGSQGESTSAGADDSLASFSNYGPAIDMAAPGVQIYSTTKNGGYAIASGTSMAAPHVAGAAALYISENPTASTSQIIAALKSQGSTSSNDCDGNDGSNSYFTGDKDSSNEPLLHIKSVTTSPSTVPTTATPTNNGTSNGTSSSGRPSSGDGISIGGNTTGTNIGNATGISINATDMNNTQQANDNATNATMKIASGDTWYFLRQFGQGTLNDPHGVALDKSTGRVYVADTGNARIVVFKSDGTLEGAIPPFGTNDFGDGGPEDLVIAPLGNGPEPEQGVYVTSPGTDRINVYSMSGDLLVQNDLGYSPGGIGYGTASESGEVQWWVTEPTQDDPMIHYYVADSPPGTLDLAGQFIPTVPGGFVGRPTDVICCLSPDISGDEQKVYVAEPNGQVGINVYDSATPPHQQWIQCCALEDTYGIDVIPGPGALGRLIFTNNGIHGGSNVISLYPDLGFAGQVDSGDGLPGSGIGEVNRPRGIDVDASEEGPGSGTDTVYVADTGNDRIQVFVNTDPGSTGDAEISMTLNPYLPKWGHEFTAEGTATGAGENDKISIDWGDGTTFTEIFPVPVGGEFTATHIYDISAATSPDKLVVAKLLSGSEVERARAEVLTTIQKHATSLTLGMNPSPDSAVCSNCHFTTFGKLVDVENHTETATFPSEISGKTIAFSGSGTSTLVSVPTEGLTFTGVPNKPLTLTSSVLRMYVGSQVDLTYSGVSASGVTLDFSAASGSSVGVTLTKAVAPFDTVSVNVPVGSPQNIAFAKGFSKLTISSVGGSSSPSQYADLATIITRDIQVSPQEQFEIHFNNVVPDPGQYPVLVINPGSYHAAGLTQAADANGLKVKAQFVGTSDPAYLTATSPEISYNVDSSAAGTGTGDTTPDDTTVWTKLNVGSGTAAGDVCTFNGVAGTDTDKDNICDRWENPSPTAGSPGNSATHRYVMCPTTTGHAAAIDPQCPITPGQVPTIKYDLCNPICPTLNKKDIYVEIDSKTGFVPTTTAINNVIRAFANAPNGGITLHVRTDDSVSSIPNNLFAWKDPASVNFNDNNAANDFFNIKKTNFGTAAERGGTSGMPGMTTAAWSSTGKTLKHYFTHYGLSVNFYSRTSGQACPTGGLSSGVGELLGNDFIVSLGCGWGTFGDNARSNANQAGTIMHELGHNIGLHHGGPAKIVVGSRTSSDYNMNCKPNYLSVMNYARQLPWDLVGASGVGTDDVAIWEGDKLTGGLYNYGQDATLYSTMLDYSRTTLPSQNEASINEAAGTTAADGKKYRIVYVKTTAGTVAVGTDGANFDFSGNGQIATIPGDINNIGSKVAGCGPLSPEIENSYNDWNEINLVFLPDPDSQDGVTQRDSDPYTTMIEATPSFGAAIKAKAFDKRAIFAPYPNTAGTSTFKVGDTVPFVFVLLDKDNKFIKTAKVTFVAQKGPTQIVGSFHTDLKNLLYHFSWKTPNTAQTKGQWTISYFIDYQTPNQVLLQGPQAQASGGLFTLKITGK